MNALRQRWYSTAKSSLPMAVIPKTGKRVSRVGFGAYRISQPAHAMALEEAIQSGINIIDTGANFEQGASERVIGDTVHALVSAGRVEREQLVLLTKSGYLNASDIEPFDAFKDYVQISEKSFHAVSPRILEHQLAQSLQRLKTNKIDIFMINAPERMLMARNRRYTTSHLYKDLAECFRYLDAQVRNGIIGGYGICSNTMAFRAAADHVSLEEALNCTQHPENFVAVEAPFNLFEPEVVTAGKGSVSSIARDHDIYLMTNRPLNTIAQGQIRVLVNHLQGSQDEHVVMDQMTRAFQSVSNLEAQVISELPLDEEDETMVTKFVWGQVLSENLQRLSQNHFATQHYLTQQVMPAVHQDLASLQHYASRLDSEERVAAFTTWIDAYRQGMETLVDSMVSYAYVDMARKNNDLDRVMRALCPSLGQESAAVHSPLTVKVLRFLLAHPEVGTLFTGMRQVDYVRDAVLAAARSVQKPLNDEDVNDIWRCPLFHG